MSGKPRDTRSSPNAGEYDEATRAFVESGKVDKAAKQATRDVSGPDADALKRAETEGKRHSRGEDPWVKRSVPEAH